MQKEKCALWVEQETGISHNHNLNSLNINQKYQEIFEETLALRNKVIDMSPVTYKIFFSETFDNSIPNR